MQEQFCEIKIITYNARGLKDKLKLKRILNKCYVTLKKNRDTFFFFQETHLDEDGKKQLEFLWRHGAVFSPSVGRQGGSMILYDESWEVIKSEVDDVGRMCLLSVKKYNEHLCFCNIYAPNDHSINFFSNIYESLANHNIEYPGVNIILGGDFNLVMGQNDMINRSANNAEVRSRDFIIEQNALLGMRDCYRINNTEGGFTWSRGNCMSRLDMIFVSKTLIRQGIKTKIEWGFDTSDHAMVEVQLKVLNGALENQLNILKSTKEHILLNGSYAQSQSHIDDAIAEMEEVLKIHLEKQAKLLILKSGAKWYEEGEKSNSYFLNLIKKRAKETYISKMEGENGQLTSQKEISEHIVNFYASLYEEKETNDNYDELLSDLPQLSPEDRNQLDVPITLEELKATLDQCNESAPGPDGIPYKVYKLLWDQVGKFLLEAWNHSVGKGILPEDQRISCITLLPKSGKNLEKIENWRPITLTNCDLKIFTKLISNRVAKKLDKLISVSQTAYIPGRVVHDNLRMFEFYKDYCRKENIDALLISLDAKKAFDSVSHKYLQEVLRAYGFSEEFIALVKLLYKDIKANIMINGFKSVIIRIARSVKQGDALSCALFILCIDPLIRKIENDRAIVSIPVPRSRHTNIMIKGKIGAFADDVGAAVMNEPNTIKAIFKNYSIFSEMSGIELNLDKTEILKLNINSTDEVFNPVAVNVGGSIVMTKESIKICGITFSNNLAREYKANVLDKIIKLEKQLIMWLPRCLTLEGKILIVKTFGLSQLIYSMQMCEFKQVDLNRIESTIFKFFWNRKWQGSAPDRIKRSHLKKSYARGGLNAPDMKILDKALKTRQFIRAMASNHDIKLVQMFHLEHIGYFEYHKLEYAKICKNDVIVSSYQQTVNLLTDHIRQHRIHNNEKAKITSASIIASTDIIEYFRRKNIPLVLLQLNELVNYGVETFQELLNESLYPRNDRLRDVANDILSFFPSEWPNIVNGEDFLNANITLSEQFYAEKWTLKSCKKINVKNIRTLLIECQVILPIPYENVMKFELNNLNELKHNPFILARKALNAPKDRFFKYRLLHGDVFCNTRMFKFKMVGTPNCLTCGNLETIKHLIWDCPRSKNVWKYINELTSPKLGREYVNYNNIMLGNEKTLPAMEVLIVWALRLIMAIEREQPIQNEQILATFRTLFFYESNSFGKTSKKMKARWGELLDFIDELT